MRPWFDGWRRVVSAPALIAGVFLVTLLAALPLALTLRGALRDHLGSSLAANEAADGVNYDWWQEFTSQASGIGTTFTPSVIGFATTLDSVSGLLDRRTPITPVASALGVYLAVWLFISGGIIDRYARGRRVGSHGFFAASGTFFFRFLRLGVVAAAVYWFLFAYVHEWLFARWYVNMTRDVAVEQTVFSWRLLMYAIFAALLALTAVVFDYAKIRAVVEDRRSMTGALIAALRFIVRHPGRVAGVYALNAAVFLAIVAIWAAVAPGAGGSGASMWAGFAASQCYILARLVVKLQGLASGTAVFQRSLAHWGYTAVPLATRPEPPVIRLKADSTRDPVESGFSRT
ncbi:MAG TPA: hypothetical protein VGJ52_13250 [Vicinamibacterales bacterium]